MLPASPGWWHCTESAHLLGRLINACPRLVLPYVSPILKVLVAKLRVAPSLQITIAGPSGTAAKANLVQGAIMHAFYEVSCL